jgi:hypothetical protein
VEVESEMAHELLLDLRRLVSRDIVDDEMDIEILGHAAIDEVRESTELYRPMPLGHVGNDLPSGHVEGKVEVDRGTSHVVMCAPLRQFRTKWKHRRGPIEGLDLGLLVDTEHESSDGSRHRTAGEPLLAQRPKWLDQSLVDTGRETAVCDPPLLVAVTWISRERLRSAEVRTYEVPVAPTMTWQFAPEALHRSHWYS